MDNIARKKIIGVTLKFEGGYANYADDTGGETNFGITAATLAATNGRYGVTDVKDLTEDIAAAIYNDNYLIPGGAVFMYDTAVDRGGSMALALSFATLHFDGCINHGVGRAVKFLQESLNLLNRKGESYADIAVDGAFGGQSRAAFLAYLDKNKNSLELLYKTMVMVRSGFYVEITRNREENETFWRGWLNRLWHFVSRASELNK